MWLINKQVPTFVAEPTGCTQGLAGRRCKVRAGRVHNAGLADRLPEFCTSLALTFPS
jgi:hypothetical protein